MISRRRGAASGFGFRWAAVAIGAGALSVALASEAMVVDTDVSTSFNFIDLSGDFSLGTAPRTVTFTGGEAKTVGLTSLYRTGLFAFLVDAGDTARIEFETPAAVTEFYAKQNDPAVAGTIQAYDASLMPLLDEPIELGSVFEQVRLEAAALGAAVKRIELTNAATASGDYVAVDDFSFRAIPEPASWAVLGAGGAWALSRRRRKR